MFSGISGSLGLAYENIKIKNSTTETISRNGVPMGKKTNTNDLSKNTTYGTVGVKYEGKKFGIAYNTS